MSGKNKPGREPKKPKAKTHAVKETPATPTHAEQLLKSFESRR